MNHNNDANDDDKVVINEEIARTCGITSTMNPSDVKSLSIFLCSYNYMHGLKPFINLLHLEIINQSITKIEGLEQCKHLEHLSLMSNHIVDISGLEYCCKLRELILDENYITTMNANTLASLSDSLTLLSVCYNRLQSLDGVQCLNNLEILRVAHNEIHTVDEYLNGMANLHELNLAGNRIYSLTEILHLTKYRSLRVLYLHDPLYGDNPVCTLAGYDNFSIYFLYFLHQLDGIILTSERIQAISNEFQAKLIYYEVRLHAVRQQSDHVIANVRETMQQQFQSLMNQRAQLCRQLLIEYKDTIVDQIVSIDGKYRHILQSFWKLQEETRCLSSYLTNVADLELRSANHCSVVYSKGNEPWFHTLEDTLNKKCMNAKCLKVLGIKKMTIKNAYQLKNTMKTQQYIEYRRSQHLNKLVNHCNYGENKVINTSVINGTRKLLNEECMFAVNSNRINEMHISDICEYGIATTTDDTTIDLCDNFILCEWLNVDTMATCSNLEEKIEKLCEIDSNTSTHRIIVGRACMTNCTRYNNVSKSNGYTYEDVLLTNSMKCGRHIRTHVQESFEPMFVVEIQIEWIVPSSSSSSSSSVDKHITYVPRAKELQSLHPGLGCIVSNFLHASEQKFGIHMKHPHDDEWFMSDGMTNSDICVCLCAQNINIVSDIVSMLPNDCTNIQYMNLSFNNLSNIDMMCFTRFTNLHTLDVSHNTIAEVYNSNNDDYISTITHLNLSHNNIDNIFVLWNILCNFPKLLSINILWNPITESSELMNLGHAFLRHMINHVTTDRPNYLYINGMIVEYDEKIMNNFTTNICIYNIPNVHYNAIEKSLDETLPPYSLWSRSKSLSQPLQQQQQQQHQLCSSIEWASMYMTHDEFDIMIDRLNEYGDASTYMVHELNLSYNFIDQCVHIGRLHNVQYLNLSHNQLCDCDLEGIGELKHLYSLNLCHNRLTTLHVRNIASASFQHLRLLLLDHNEITSLSPFKDIQTLRMLSLRSNCIGDHFNGKIQQQNIITELKYISHDYLTELYSLHLEENAIIGVENYRELSIYMLKNLQVLDGLFVSKEEHDNAYEKYFGALTLDMLQRQLGCNTIDALKSTRHIKFCENQPPLRSIHIITQTSFNELQHLCLNDNHINDIECVGVLPFLKILQLNNNHITHLPSSSSKQSGTYCSVSFPMLEVLELGGNRITNIMHLNIQYMKQLKVLSLPNNQINEITHGFEGLDSLQQLILTNNNLKNIETFSFHCVPQLRGLRLDDNVLRSSIITSICTSNLSELRFLYLQGNRISHSGHASYFMTGRCAFAQKLSHLSLFHNPVSRRHLYRSTFISKLPALIQFDGQNVTPEEHIKAELLHNCAGASSLTNINNNTSSCVYIDPIAAPWAAAAYYENSSKQQVNNILGLQQHNNIRIINDTSSVSNSNRTLPKLPISQMKSNNNNHHNNSARHSHRRHEKALEKFQPYCSRNASTIVSPRLSYPQKHTSIRRRQSQRRQRQHQVSGLIGSPLLTIRNIHRN